MKKYFSSIIIFLIAVWVVPSSAQNGIVPAMKGLEISYPSIPAQTEILSADNISGIDFQKAFINLKKYIADSGPDVLLGWKLVLQEDYFLKCAAPAANGIKIDGKDTEWGDGGFAVNDSPTNNPSKNPAFDITGASFVIDGDMLYGVYRTAKKPANPGWYLVLIDCTGDGYCDFQVGMGWNAQGVPGMWMNDLIAKKNSLPVKAEFAADGVFEFSLPLSQFGLSASKYKQNILIWAQSSDNAFKYVESCEPAPVMYRMENSALALYLFLLSKDCYKPGDSITAALALANSMIYSMADDEVKKAIAEDAVMQYHFYRKLVDWQNGWQCPYALEKAALVPKIFWADRSRYSYGYFTDAMYRMKLDKMSMEIYREFIDRIDVLDKIHAIVADNGLAVTDMEVTARNIEDWVHAHRMYLSSIENMDTFYADNAAWKEQWENAHKLYKEGKYYVEYLGKKYRWDDFRWINYQYNYLIKEGCFIGDCGDTTVAQMALYRAAGIAPASFQHTDPYGTALASHNYPAHYDPNLKRWYVYQIPRFYSGGKEMPDTPIVFYFNKPYWHPWKSKDNWKNIKKGNGNYAFSYFYPGESVNSLPYGNFMVMGMSESLMEFLFFSNITLQEGTIFNKDTAPKKIADTDGDGLPDSVEKDYGTDAKNWDTDGDGVSDYWEITHALDPLVKNPQSVLAVDGFLADWNAIPGKKFVIDPPSDSKVKQNIFDISNFNVYSDSQNIYLGAGFYGNPAGNKAYNMEFWINFPGMIPTTYWYGGGYMSVWGAHNLLRTAISVLTSDGKWTNLICSIGNDYIITGNSLEAVLPLKYIGNPVWADITFLVNSGSEGKEVDGSDLTERILYQLQPDADGDNLSDSFEKTLGIDPAKWDTDGDLISDNWEYWHGYDPKSAKSPALKGKAALDGFSGDIEKLPGAVSVTDPQGDPVTQENLFDISTIAAGISADTLYIGVKFYNNQLGNLSKNHCLWITTDGGKEYWVGGGWDSLGGMAYNQPLLLRVKKGEQWTDIPATVGAEIAIKQDVEFAIPLKYIGNPKTISFIYYVTFGPKDKETYGADQSELIKVK
ncbi:MAG: hypothetical protein A2014_02810 [Spirochaetes bacterium GWF1_49_6]|nr:MAG: hypothetical protein A2014_02810 [Spirochaetes bacterium GWF1_49_6]